MNTGEQESFSIRELADRAGVTRRVIRFYVQSGLLDPPKGLGRGARYRLSHLKRLGEVARLQALGHSLQDIRRLLGQGEVESVEWEPRGIIAASAGDQLGQASPFMWARPPNVPSRTAALWSRMQLLEGVELHVQPSVVDLTPQQVAEVRRAIVEIVYGKGPPAGPPRTRDSGRTTRKEPPQ